MESDRIESLTLVAAVIGAAILGSHSPGMGFGEAAIGDIAILVALFAFDGPTVRAIGGSLAFGAAAAFCLLNPLDFVASNVLGAAILANPNHWMLFGIWLFLALVLFGVDRFRMGSRDIAGLAISGSMAGSGPISMTSPAQNYRPAAIRVDSPSSITTPKPVYTPAPMPAQAIIPDPDPAYEAPTFSAPPVLPPPPPDVTAVPPGRETLIYLNLVGEGLNVLRTVRAENLGRDYFRIADIMPEGEQWEFTPGMVVRCRKKSLSNGKQLVAYEEAQRAL